MAKDGKISLEEKTSEEEKSVIDIAEDYKRYLRENRNPFEFALLTSVYGSNERDYNK